MRSHGQVFQPVLIGLLLGWLLVAPLGSAGATAVVGTYPNTGYWNIDANTAGGQGFVRMRSNKCYAEELTFYSTAQKQLIGSKGGSGIAANSGQYNGAWPYGIIFYLGNPRACSTTIDNLTDDYLHYMSSTDFLKIHTNVGGVNMSTKAPTSFCTYWGITNPPCGYHITQQDINLGHWTGYSSTYRVNFLFHETGHGMGWYDDCSAVSVSNNGVNCALSGGYKSGDRSTLRNTLYKNSPYSKY